MSLKNLQDWISGFEACLNGREPTAEEIKIIMAKIKQSKDIDFLYPITTTYPTYMQYIGDIEIANKHYNSTCKDPNITSNTAITAAILCGNSGSDSWVTQDSKTTPVGFWATQDSIAARAAAVLWDTPKEKNTETTDTDYSLSKV